MLCEEKIENAAFKTKIDALEGEPEIEILLL